jgi:hypothetical protein
VTQSISISLLQSGEKVQVLMVACAPVNFFFFVSVRPAHFTFLNI